MHRAVLLVALALPSVAHAAISIDGTVYVDLNGDGLFSAGEPVVPGAVVGWEDLQEVRADAQGHYHIDAPYGGVVWVRIPDGFSPAPVYRLVGGANTVITSADLGLRPRTTMMPLTFVHGSDTHLGLTTADQTAQSFREATALDPEPAFVVVTGDLTDNSLDAEFTEFVQAAADGLSVPLVPVTGNHDMYDGGASFRGHLGPPTYSFDAGSVHFIVLNHMSPDEYQLAFIQRDLAFSPPGQTVVVFRHVPPQAQTADAFAQAGVSYLLTGHIHQNQLTTHASLLEINTETMVMGGSDYSPAGYRIIQLGADRKLDIRHHTVVDRPIVTLARPDRSTCIAPGAPDVTATVELGAPPARVEVTIDGARVPVTARGPWTFTGTGPQLGVGLHAYRVEAAGARGETGTEEGMLCVAALPPAPAPTLGDWPQLQGDPAHTGRTASPVAPPLVVRWATDVGAHVRGGSPVVHDGRVFVGVEDLSDGTQGGMVALDAATGATLWEDRTGVSVHNAAAASDGVVVFIDADGALQADDAATGRRLWSVDLVPGAHSACFVSTAPAIDDGLVFAGTAQQFGAYDLASGARAWTASPLQDADGPTTYTTPAIAAGEVFDGFGYATNAFYTWAVADGTPHWTVSYPDYFSVQVSPVVDGGIVFNVNVDNTAQAWDVASGHTIWSRDIDGGGLMWGYAPVATPAVAQGRLFVATPHQFLYALDAATGAEVWRASGGYASIHAVKYRVSERGFLASPVVTGDIVWAGGADGVLRALAVGDGTLLWSDDFRVPILSAPAVAGPALVLATYDGTVRLLVPARPGEAHADGAAGGGCAVGGGGGGAPLIGLALLLARFARRRRARNR
jgi:outer membrane protein assembly factor BamB/predicted phosphodiesterase